MRRWIFSTFALFLLAAMPASAQPTPGGPQGSNRERDRTQTQQQQRDTSQRGHRAAPIPRPSAQSAQPGPRRVQSTVQRRETRRWDWNTYRPGAQPPRWNEFRRTFNMRLYQNNLRSPQRYHYRPYIRPHGWYYRHWVFGQLFPPIFWTRDYWIVDYWIFGLIDPPYGYVWVRYDGDAILVNVQTGVILRVVYGVFY